jgi:hypothetical protein
MLNLSSTPSKNQNAEIIRVIVPLVIVVIILIFGNKLLKGLQSAINQPLEALGIADTKEEKRAKEALNQNVKAFQDQGLNSPFNPNYYKNLEKQAGKNGIVTLLTHAMRERLTKQIWDAIGVFSDTPSQIESAFNTLTTKAQVSHLAERFSTRYKRDLLGWLTEKLDTTDQKEALLRITQLVNKLPSGLNRRR